MASDRERSSGAGLGWASGRLPRWRSSPDVDPATGAAGHPDGDLGAAGARLPPAGGRQRLLRRPRCDRPTRRRDHHPGPGDGEPGGAPAGGS